MRSGAFFLAACLVLAPGAGEPQGRALAADEALTSETLLDSSKTVLGEAVPYPEGDVHFKSFLITLAPGQETGWHRHGAPIYGYLLEGRITVDYGEKGSRTFEAGEALFETSASWHNGQNPGDVPAKILVVYLSDGKTPLTEFRDK